MGIDPGLTRCGLGVVELGIARSAVLVTYGLATSSGEDAHEKRLHDISTSLETWLDEHRPGMLAIERVFAQHNVSTVLGTAQVVGLAMVLAHRRDIPVSLHTPSEVKAAVTGSGRADKKQVQRMVASILKMPKPPTPADAADALALSICCLWKPRAHTIDPQDDHRTPAQRQWAAADRASRVRM